nr:MAG TPA: hypothetical protein [Caudoviricetes sp.]
MTVTYTYEDGGKITVQGSIPCQPRCALTSTYLQDIKFKRTAAWWLVVSPILTGSFKLTDDLFYREYS